MERKKISIVIPAYNEADVIADTVKLIKAKEGAANQAGFDLEVVTSNNASTDNTAEEAESAGARVVFEGRKGYGNALKRGFAEAEGDYIVMGDADLTYPLEDFLDYIQPLIKEDFDLVIGNRYNRNIEPGALKFVNRSGGRALSILGNTLFGTKIRDWHCGMRAFTKESIEAMNLESEGMEFASEIVIKAALTGQKIKQVDIYYRKRAGTSKLNTLEDGWRHVVFIFGSYFRNRRSKKQ